MAFIDYIEYDEASPELQKLYKKYGRRERKPANIVRIAGLHPPTMDSNMAFYRAIMFDKSPLSRAQREMIATVVSAINECHY